MSDDLSSSDAADQLRHDLRVERLAGTRMTDAELLQALDYLRNTMIAVATGGPRIDDVNHQFQQTYADVAAVLARRGIASPTPYGNLWDWYGRWSSGDLPTYPLINRIRTGRVEQCEATGWERVDRNVGELRDRLASSTTEEQFQAVGLLCREALISLAQAVYVPERHPTLDGVAPSPTDGKRMLEAYVAVELGGGRLARGRDELLHDPLGLAAIALAEQVEVVEHVVEVVEELA